MLFLVEQIRRDFGDGKQLFPFLPLRVVGGNYLLGLRVSHTDTIRGFKVVTGLNPAGEKTLVIWRNVAEKSNADLDAFFQKQGYNTKDMEFAVIYVNGDNNLENLKRADETWKVRRTEDEFKRLMFDVQDV